MLGNPSNKSNPRDPNFLQLWTNFRFSWPYLRYKGPPLVHNFGSAFLNLKTVFPVETGRKLNSHKTSRGHSGGLLNVLCTFNLSPVSVQSTNS